MKGFLTVDETPLEVGNILRSDGAGNRIMQVLLIRGKFVYLVSAGTIKAGTHTMPNRPHVIIGTLEGNRVYAATGQSYTKVKPRTKLPKLMLSADPADPTPAYVNQ